MVQKRLELLRGVRSQLRYHASIGIGDYPANDDIQSFLSNLSLDGGLFHKQQAPLQVPSGRPAVVSGGDARADEIQGKMTLAEIADEVNNCQACNLHERRIYAVPGKGAEKVRLMIIGDWLAADGEGELPAGLLFGVEQDRMLSRMLEAIKLPRQHVFVTNVIKCAVDRNCQPQVVHLQSCSSFLRRQIGALRPELICTMGMVAARALLEKSQPLSRLRSQFHSYSPGGGMDIPVLVTYHPTFLLQNPEMKRAAWVDLQRLAAKLGLEI